jgi:hypothetical protein
MDFSEEEIALVAIPFCEASNRLSEVGDLLESGDITRAIHVLAVALSSTIAEANSKIDELNDRIEELVAQSTAS